jgi:putative hydrolase of the HAD superfamily
LFSNFGGNLVNYLNDLGITELFEHIVNSYDLGEEKPNKEAYIKMLEVIGMRPEEVIFIDDKPSNVAGAEAVGIKSIIFQNSKQLKEDLSRIIDF